VNEAFRRDLPRFGTAADRTSRAAQLRAGIDELLSPDVVDRFLTDRDAQAPALPRLGLPWVATSDLLPPDDSAEVRLLTPRAVLLPEERTVTLLASGSRFVFASAAEPVLSALLPGLPVSVGSLLAVAGPALDRTTVRALLGELITQGLLSSG
jgi:hypothetical protein